MSIENVNSCNSKQHSSILPKAVTALVLLVPSDRAIAGENIFERQPKTDTYEFSSKELIDLKDDGSYKIVNPDSADRTMYFERAMAPKKEYDKNKKNDDSSKKMLAMASLLCVLAASGVMIYSQSVNLINKIAGLREKNTDLEIELLKANDRNDSLSRENDRLKKENEKLRKRPRMVL